MLEFGNARLPARSPALFKILITPESCRDVTRIIDCQSCAPNYTVCKKWCDSLSKPRCDDDNCMRNLHGKKTGIFANSGEDKGNTTSCLIRAFW